MTKQKELVDSKSLLHSNSTPRVKESVAIQQQIDEQEDHRLQTSWACSWWSEEAAATPWSLVASWCDLFLDWFELYSRCSMVFWSFWLVLDSSYMYSLAVLVASWRDLWSPLILWWVPALFYNSLLCSHPLLVCLSCLGYCYPEVQLL